LGESRGLAFDDFNIKIDDARLSAQVSGAAIADQNKEIKAVTYHDLKIQEGPRGLEAKIVFDV
jgi:SHS2 domain-containing protein